MPPCCRERETIGKKYKNKMAVKRVIRIWPSIHQDSSLSPDFCDICTPRHLQYPVSLALVDKYIIYGHLLPPSQRDCEENNPFFPKPQAIISIRFWYKLQNKKKTETENSRSSNCFLCRNHNPRARRLQADILIFIRV